MKKEYTAPKAIVRSLVIENSFCAMNSIYNEVGDGNQFSKEFDADDEDDYWD